MSSTTTASSIEQFLRDHEHSELLRFSTAGSVDDGKSTLIGRLLYDTKGVYEDQLAAVKNSRINRSTGEFDLSLLTDGLRAEREQGITIDVAYRYFHTPRRKFIIADTPGHEQYTRNMATGASTASLAVILVDARKGVLPQSRRHCTISWLLGIPHLVVAINKMDLVDWSEAVYNQIRADFLDFVAPLGITGLVFIPMSALEGDNVVEPSRNMPWYDGPPLLEYLETAPIDKQFNFHDLRFPVQYVVRPDLDFRGYSGQLASGVLRAGQRITVLPSGRTSRVRSITTWEGDLPEAFAPMSVTVTLEDEIDISRGDMLVDPARMPHVSRRFEAHLVWMSDAALAANRPYLLKHTTQTTGATITTLRHRLNINTLAQEHPEGLSLNEIGLVEIETARPLFFDSYHLNRATGAFILIDPVTNSTVAAGMIAERKDENRAADLSAALRSDEFSAGRLTPAERYARWRHQPATVWLTARRDLAYLLERRLFDRGCLVHAVVDDFESHVLPELARFSNLAGMIAICSSASDDPEGRARAERLIGPDRFLAPEPERLNVDDSTAAQQIIQMLENKGILPVDRFQTGEGI
ncbi:MAG: sulfate adenylyltransferase subunit CysN [Bryobacterales bacterium]|nr:sulfate adenylyltransferase subunit CysN [Bryobacterales bacterium]